ncbi:hypothetical protein A3Q56_07557 [Intoshia linei]|uniref:PiggyBac transposable element-derived protein domain-containing protein n=1 Tax=Intoshia linei TaxID=1819745 RepID=A0A177AT68_9BILA|nr:hypothetical protein A3Q56_07557 [Intoshia linei]
MPRFNTLNDAIENVDTDLLTDIIMVGPPQEGYDSDLEEIEECNLLQDSIPNDVAGQLEILDDELEYVEPIVSKLRRKDWNLKLMKKFKIGHLNGILDSHPNLVKFNEFDIFMDGFKSILQVFVKETNRYAKQKNKLNFKTNLSELLNFFGLIFLTGYNQRQSEQLYFSKGTDIECPIFERTIELDFGI